MTQKNIKSFPYLFNWAQYIQILKKILIPNELKESVEDINFEHLYHKGFTTLFFDIDNTILTHDQKELTLQKVNLLKKLKAIGFQIYLISNNSNKKRVARICRQIQVYGTYFSLKPSVFSMRETINDLQLLPQNIIMIGDQLLTDVISGNWLKLYTILVDPIDKKEFFLKTLQRELELFLLKKLK